MSRLRAVLVSQGDEVITGQTVDSNAAWLAERLTDLGFDVCLQLTVADRIQDIQWALALGCERADVLICTGGLGPTQDDLTMEAVARLTGDTLCLRPPALEHIQALYRSLGLEMPQSNRKQAMLPAGATMLQNDWGTAPGLQITHLGCQAFFVPGVPKEMRQLWQHRIAPELRSRFELTPERLVTFRCMGVHESKLAELLQPIDDLPGVTLGFRTMSPENQVKLRLSPELSQETEAALTAQVRALLGKRCFGVNSPGLPQVIGEALAQRGETVATAESCTGGLVSSQLTSVPGSSGYFLQGVCAYSNASKSQLCGVPEQMITEHGAVSRQVALALAEGIQARAGSTYGLATTGIAGPGGGSPDKPVGTVHIACATPSGVLHRQLRLRGGRARITALSAGSVLDMLRLHLQGLI